MPQPSPNSLLVVDEVEVEPTGEAQLRAARAAGWHNALHLLLAALGAVMLGAAFLDWLIHPLSLWTAVP